MIPLGFNRNTAAGQEALAEIAMANNPLIRTIQRSPRAADMPPDPPPVFKSDPRFPSKIVNEVHQDLRNQSAVTGGVTGNNDAAFPYEARMQAGENIVPTGLNAGDAVAMVDDAITNNPVAMMGRGQASDARGIGVGIPSKVDQQIAAEVLSDAAREKFAHSAAGLRAQARANQLLQQQSQQPRPIIDDDDDSFLWGSARSNPTPTPTPVVQVKPQTEDDYYDQAFAQQVNRNPYGMPDVQRNAMADSQETDRIIGDNGRGSGRPNQLLNNTLATGAAVGGGLGAMTLINNALNSGGGNSNTGNVDVVTQSPTPRAHFVIDKTNNIAQSFIDRGDGQLQPYKTMDIQGARDAWAKAKQAGWATSFE